jgi:hypothetical protein
MGIEPNLTVKKELRNSFGRFQLDGSTSRVALLLHLLVLYYEEGGGLM